MNPGDITYSTQPNDEYTYYWEITPPEAGTTESDSATAIVTWSAGFIGETEIKVRAANECGESDFSEALTITIADAPETPSAPEGDASLCVNPGESVYETTPNESYLYSWEIEPSEAGTTGSDSATAIVAWSDDYTGEVEIRVLAFDECGESEFSNALTVIIHEEPEVNLGEDQEVCIGMTVTLDAGNEGASYQWSTGETTQTIHVDTTGMDENNNLTISVQVTDQNDCSEVDEIVINFMDCSNISENAYLNSVEVYPNPSNGYFTLQLDANENQKAQIELINQNGELVYVENVQFVKETNKFNLNANHLTNQLYYLRVVSDKDVVTKKVIIKK